MISLWTALGETDRLEGQRLHGARGEAALAELRRASWLGTGLDALSDRSVLLMVKDQLAAALAMIELDGLARRMVLCPYDLAAEHRSAVAAATEADALVHDHGSPPPVGGIGCVVPFGKIAPLQHGRGVQRRTEWVLLTSGTTGPPKAVLHTLSSLTAAFGAGATATEARVWSTFYDIRRYGGLQILLRALLGGNSMVLAHPDEAVDDFLRRAGECGVTHISGTPSHWRRALMSGRTGGFMPRYVRLSGEIADQGILDRLRAAFPAADIAHAFASTEAGVAFSVADGRAGFPADLLERQATTVDLKIVDGSLRVRSAGVAQRYLGDGGREIPGADGFVDTRDLIERQGDRCCFVGRRDGIINVGGMKVNPEEVEAVINGHPQVHLSLARARRNVVLGAVVEADIVLAAGGEERLEAVRSEILETCRRALAPHKVPVRLRFVPSLEVGHTGKLARPAPDRAAAGHTPFSTRDIAHADSPTE